MTAEYIKTFVILFVFLILSVSCIINIIRHSKERKIEKAEKRARGIKLASRDPKEKTEGEASDTSNPFEVSDETEVLDLPEVDHEESE